MKASIRILAVLALALLLPATATAQGRITRPTAPTPNPTEKPKPVPENKSKPNPAPQPTEQSKPSNTYRRVINIPQPSNETPESTPSPTDLNGSPDELYRKGIELFNDSRYKSAEPYIRKSADMGHSGAQYILGYMFHMDIISDYNNLSTIHWYKKAADQGHLQAIRNLAEIYKVNGDISECIKYYKKAAQIGDCFSSSHLGMIYEEGKLVPKDFSEATKWYKLTLNKKDGYLGQYKLAEMYKDGRGVKKNKAEAVRLYRMSLENGFSLAKDRLQELGYGE